LYPFLPAFWQDENKRQAGLNGVSKKENKWRGRKKYVLLRLFWGKGNS
jgi:hypothetical protein